ncbi:MAG: methyltransferase family protein [Acidobacteriota bacterium]
MRSPKDRRHLACIKDRRHLACIEDRRHLACRAAKIEPMIFFLFSIVSYLIGMSSLFYFFWLVEFGNRGVPAFTPTLLLINIAIFLIFPLQHSLLPRKFVRERMNPYVHRSFYVLTSGVALWIVLLVWRPFGPFLYRDVMPWLFNILFYTSLILIIASTYALNHSQMFGLYHGYAAWKKHPLPETKLETTGIYGIVRHPITSLLIVALWSHESLTAGRFLFNALFTIYALAGTVVEERSLVKEMGEEYREYRKKVPAFIPKLI